MKALDCPPFTPEQFQYMAMRKARGHTWDDIATQLNVPVETIERVAWTHEKQWNRTLAKAERIVARETLTDVVNTLRQDLRSVDPKVRATIANSLTRCLKQQEEYAPKKQPRPKFGPVLPITPDTPTVPTEPPKPVEPTATKPPEDPPPKPKLNIEQLLAIQKRVNARPAAVCAFLAFVCLCCFTLLRATPTTSPMVAIPFAVVECEPRTNTVARVSFGVHGTASSLAFFEAPSHVPKQPETA